MADKRPNKIITPPKGGMLRDLIAHVKLIGRLMGDSRISIFLKVLPLVSLTYLIWPFDLIAFPGIGVLDDAAVLWIGSTLFLELCPPKVVAEHMRELAGGEGDSTGDIVDAETTDIDDR